jgi:RNA-directed DNA polymerase
MSTKARGCGNVLSTRPSRPCGGQLFRITEEHLLEECRKLIQKHERYGRELRKEDVRRKRRVTSPNAGRILRPSYWEVDKGFDPYYVRSNVSSIVYAINRALSARDYAPRPPIAHKVAKSSGGTRTVSIFQIADSVVSRELFKSLSAKNRALMSARSYAYRDDLSTHDAIQYVSSEFRTDERLFIAEYDFSSYFDSISHQHLWDVLDGHNFLMTAPERRVVEAFLGTVLEDESSYGTEPMSEREPIGIPQGTSLSLFLANVAAWQMDRSLEKIGVGFVRYADDTLIWSRDYGQINEAVNVLKRESARIGASLNRKKSEGVRLFVPLGEKSEIRSTDTVDFVGYRFSRGAVGMNHSVEKRIKSRIQYLIWANLLQPLQQGGFAGKRVSPPIDRDYVVLLGQIRRYLYGHYSEAKVRQLERGATKRVRFPGVLSYFPLASDQEQLAALDGWLADVLHQAMKKRAKLLTDAGILHLPNPHGLAKAVLIEAMGKTSDGSLVDLRVPSIRRFVSVLNRAANAHGANVVGRGIGAEQYQYFVGSIEP